MADQNVNAFTGRLTQDPETKSPNNPDGKSYIEMSIAVNGYKRKGNDKEDVMFLDCMVFGQSAQYLAETAFEGRGALRGDMLAVSGYMTQDRWKDKETGKGRSKIKLMVNSVTVIRQRSDDNESRAGNSSAQGSDVGDRGAPPF